MRAHDFYATIHLDRFGDLAMLMAAHRSVIFMEPHAIGPGKMAIVHIFGEEDVTLRLETSIGRIAHILSSAPVYEEI
jgi:hypothetical protein